MTPDNDLLFSSFKEEADLCDVNWFSGRIVLENRPTPTFGLVGRFELKRRDGTQSRACSFFKKATRHLENYFRHASSGKMANEIEIIVEAKELVEVLPRWNQKIVETFESYLPKSKKGRCRPWYIDESEWSSVAGNKLPTVEMIDVKIASLSAKENGISEAALNGLGLKETALLVTGYCLEAENPFWEEGCLFLQKSNEGELTAELIQYYFEDEDDKKKGNQSFPQERALPVTDRMVSIYSALQKATRQMGSAFEWDSVFITVSRDGLADLQFILNDEELNFNFS